MPHTPRTASGPCPRCQTMWIAPRRPNWIRRVLAVLLGVLVLTLTGCGVEFGNPPVASAPQESATVTVSVPAYDRVSQFGAGWRDVNRDGCDTREEVLARDAGAGAVDSDGDGCRDDGPVLDLYTGQRLAPRQTQIDHVVALKDAYNSGAWGWTRQERGAFAQDVANLRAVEGAVNERKNDDGPDRWRPPSRDGWCTYASTYRDIKTRYRLIITTAQQHALDDMLGTCPAGER